MGAARNVVPWKEMERRVAERIAAKAAGSVPQWNLADAIEPEPMAAAPESGSTDVMPEQAFDYDDNDSGPKKRRIPAAMESGIRASRPDEEAVLNGARAMSFTVYKLEDLDARARVSSPPPAPAPEPSPWPSVWTSTLAVTAAFIAWRKQLVRPKLKEALAIPVATLRADAWAALKTLPWKKIGTYGGATVGGFMFLLFVVVAIADFTDDVKPTLHVSTEVTATLPAPAAPADPAAAAPQAAADAPAIEIDDTPTGSATAAKKPAKHAKKKKKPSAADIFNP